MRLPRLQLVTIAPCGLNLELEAMMIRFQLRIGNKKDTPLEVSWKIFYIMFWSKGHFLCL